MKRVIYLLGIVLNVILLVFFYGDTLLTIFGYYQHMEFISNHKLIVLLGFPICIIASIAVWMTNLVVWYKHRDKLVYLILGILFSFIMNPIYAVRILKNRWLWNVSVIFYLHVWVASRSSCLSSVSYWI